MSALSAIQIIAERRIEEALREGQLQVDHWRNRPLPEEDLRLVPEDLRLAFKILKNAGYLPPELETRKEIHRLEELIAATEDEHTRVTQLRKLDFLLMKLNQMRSRPSTIESDSDYYRRITERLTPPRASSGPGGRAKTGGDHSNNRDL
jgi:hypothetical protein